MGWTLLQASEDLPSGWENGSIPSLIVNEIDIAKLSYCHECGRVVYQELQSGMTLRPYVEKCCRRSISSMVASPAPTSRVQVVAKAWRESEADWFSKCSDWSKNVRPIMCSLRTSQRSVLEAENVWREHWPAEGMIVDGLLYPRPKSERLTLGKDGFVSLPTPSASSYGTNLGGGAGRTGTARPSLETMARKNLWPTPRACDYKGCLPSGTKSKRKSCDYFLPDRVNQIEKLAPGGQLNPRWVEWLMGYPPGWTELDPSATQWFRPKRVKHSKG